MNNIDLDNLTNKAAINAVEIEGGRNINYGVKKQQLVLDGFYAGVEWERSRNKWINIKDRLPMQNIPIIVSFKSRPILIARLISSFSKPIFCINVTGRIIKEKVKFWQPIPEPPKPDTK